MTEKKLTADELNKVVGGEKNKKNGMKCPRCGNFIAITMEQVIASKSIYCPHCYLHLTID